MGDITETRDELKGKGRQVVGDVKRTVGDLTGDKELQLEGEVDRLKGKAEEKVAEGKRELRKLGE